MKVCAKMLLSEGASQVKPADAHLIMKKTEVLLHLHAIQYISSLAVCIMTTTTLLFTLSQV
jgi:hypothetical protein